MISSLAKLFSHLIKVAQMKATYDTGHKKYLFIFAGSENNSLYIYYKGLSKQLLTYKFDTVRSVLVRSFIFKPYMYTCIIPVVDSEGPY